MDSDKSGAVAKFLFIEECNKRYLTPEEIRFRLPEGMDADEIINIVEGIRRQKSESLFGLTNLKGEPFRYWATSTIARVLHEIDVEGRDSKWEKMPQPISGELALEAIIDEALYSSMIEGARTTRKRAEEMVRRHVTPRDRSERMTLNNYRALEFIRRNLGRDVSKELVNELHAILVEGTLEPEDEGYSGMYRPDQRYVQDSSRGEIVYTPPPPDQVEALMQKLYSWINFESADFLYLHPVVKASVIHFYTVYIHPYVDGNGRVARALMYHHLLRKGYSFFQYFSISKAIKAKRKPYYDAIKNVEDDGADLTYFSLYSVHMVRDAIDTVERELGREQVIKKYLDSQAELNDRQKRFIKMHLKHGGTPITIRKYQKTFDVVYETARKDLMDLEEKGIVEKTKRGKQQLFALKGPSRE